MAGKLRTMVASTPAGSLNVSLQWEFLDEQSGEKPCLVWSLSVRAIRAIIPLLPRKNNVCRLTRAEGLWNMDSPEPNHELSIVTITRQPFLGPYPKPR